MTLCKQEPPTTEDQQVRAGVCVEEKGGSSSCCCSVERTWSTGAQGSFCLCVLHHVGYYDILVNEM